MPNNQDTLKLLPCPFTGREARIDQGGEDCFYGVSKGPDQAEGPVRETYEAAVKAWNTRTPTPREQELEAALEKAKEALRFYANSSNYDQQTESRDYDVRRWVPIIDDGGSIADQAISNINALLGVYE